MTTHKNSDDEFTPPEIFEPILESIGEEQFTIDVASHPESLVPAMVRCFGPHRGHEDGLAVPWVGPAWVQPPYSAPSPWIRKAFEHGRSVLLINATTDTKIWHEVIWPQATLIVFVRGRIRFLSPHNPDRKSPAKKPSAVVFAGIEPTNIEPLARLGRIVIP